MRAGLHSAVSADRPLSLRSAIRQPRSFLSKTRDEDPRKPKPPWQAWCDSRPPWRKWPLDWNYRLHGDSGVSDLDGWLVSKRKLIPPRRPRSADINVNPTPATHAIWTVLKAGETADLL